MDLRDVHQTVHRRRRPRRYGRGPGSKRGCTATRGDKGQRARSGDFPALLKEGGQMPLFRRLPKRGFNNKWKLRVAVVNVADLALFDDGESVTLERMAQFGLVKGPYDRIKILGDGEIARKLEVHAHEFSKSAREKIEKAGGTCVTAPMPHCGPKLRNKMRPRSPRQPL
jgi:large subunit ribosomal protein L15